MFREQRIGIGTLTEGRVPLGRWNEIARERVAIGVQADRRQSDDHIAGRYALWIGQRLTLDGADDGPREVEMIPPVESGHLGRFAPKQRAVVCSAGFGAAPNDLSSHGGVEFPDRKVI